jgi:hypothetical protein
MTATAAVSRDATVSLCDLIAREPERTATGQRIAHLWQRTLCQPADDARFAIADLVNARHLERTGPSQWTATRPATRPAPPATRPEPEEDTGDPTDDDGAADDPKAAYDDDPAESVRTLPVGHITVTLNAGADPAQQVTVSGPRAQVDAVVRAYLRQRVAGKAAPLAPRVSAMAPTADLETVRAKALADARKKRFSTLAPVARRIYDAIVSKPASTPDLCDREALADIPYNTLRGRISELASDGWIKRHGGGVWVAT